MISIVINTFNEKPQWLRQTIDSYLANDIQKQIIVSALPDDVNMDILESYDQIEICLCDPDKHPGHGINGIYYQLHEGIKRVRGEWFCYMSSNDFVKPDRLKTELNYCLENKKLICYSDFHEVNETGTVTGSRRFFDYDYSKHIWKGNFVSDAALINTKLLIKYLPYRNELLGNYSHWDFWLRVYEGEGNVDIGWIGHTHQSSYEHFSKGGKEYLAVVSGSYKVEDPWAARKGISLNRAGKAGITLMLWPQEKRMQCFKDIEVAQQHLLGMMWGK